MLTLNESIISVIVLVSATTISFFLKEQFQKFLDYRKLKRKLNRIAPLQTSRALVLYEKEIYRLTDIDSQGIILEGDTQTIFIPIKKALDNILFLPVKEYEKAKEKKEKEELEKMKKAMREMGDLMIEEMMPKLYEKMKGLIVEDVLMEEGDISIAMGMKITTFLKNEGIELKKIDKKPKKEEKSGGS